MGRLFRWALIVLGVLILGSVALRIVLPSEPTGPVIGIIEIEGAIGETGERWERAAGGTRDVLRQIEQARQDPRVEAVVVRINSPGGSPASSQEIHGALQSLRSEGTPVVASLADVAASGGYYVAVAANRILANPGTLTGSIGVVTQVITVSRRLEEWGIDVEVLTSGAHKAIGNPFEPLTPADREVLRASLDDLHDQFVNAVADGRGLSVERVRELADGRTYTGRQALDLGLIDELGGLQDSIRVASKLAGLPEVPPVVHFRRPVGVWERLLDPVLSILAAPFAGRWHPFGGYDSLQPTVPRSGQSSRELLQRITPSPSLESMTPLPSL